MAETIVNLSKKRRLEIKKTALNSRQWLSKEFLDLIVPGKDMADPAFSEL
jgi:hypothetical protein